MQATTIVEGFRLSPQQRRLWKLQHETSTNSWVFTSQLVFLFLRELRVDTLRAAVGRVCARHESLRTVFRRLSGVVMPVQVVGEDVSVSWQVIDTDKTKQTAEKLIATEVSRAFDYENGPLVNATLITLAQDRHLLSITIPTMCADRRSLSNFASELWSELIDKAAGDEPLQYIQFSEWQNSLAEEDDAEKGREFWARQDVTNTSAFLAGQRVRQRVPLEIPRELQSTTLSLSPELTTRIAALATKNETSSATVLLAAWQTLLWRLTQQSVVTGNVTEGRSFEQLHDGFGLFARVLPVRCQFTDDLRFIDVICELDRFQHESEEWQDYSNLDDSASSELNYFPFGFEHARSLPKWQSDGLRVSIYRQKSSFEFFDLKLTSVASEDGTALTFEYNTAIFDGPYASHVAEQFQTLLNSALADPETSVAELAIVSEAERRQIVFEWNETTRDYDLDQPIHQLFEHQVERTPDALAAVFQNEQVTFSELNHRANQLAAYLNDNGVGPETPVGISIEPSLEMLIAVLGILKAGGAYVPLDPRNPRQRIDKVLTDSGVSIVLTRELVASAQTGTASYQTETSAKTTSENLAYIIYTSGSTGQPKGVMIQHRSVANLAAALHEDVYAGLGPALKVGLSAPLAFDASVKQLLALLHGHTLHILPEELRLNAKAALHYIDQHQIDVLDCTPSQLKLLLAAGLDKNAKTIPKLMVVGGEAIDESTWLRLAENELTSFFNVYGPTECTVDATWAPITRTQAQPTIGRPVPNTQAYILDKNLTPAGIHLTGELFISGTGLARGYLNSPERTAEKFIPDELSGQEGARLYRTGDLARYTPDGSIIYTGRNDTQVKVRGHRIEPGEIEAVLQQHENVKQAVVIAREAANADVRLVGYLIPIDGTTLDTNEMRQRLSEQLPDYMVPSFLVALDELPLTRNGKVDISSLPAPETAQRSRDENYVAPRNEIEATITRVWQDVLGVERVGVNDNFFDAGGHSLLMVQAHSKLTELFDKQISIVELFAKPTISALAEYFSTTNGHKPKFDRVMDRATRRRQAVGTRQ